MPPRTDLSKEFRDLVGPLTIKKADGEDTNGWAGVVSSLSVDRQGEVVLPSALQADRDRYLSESGAFFWHHNPEKALGRTTTFDISDTFVTAEGVYADPSEVEWVRRAKALARVGAMNQMSFRFRPVKWDFEPVLPGQTGATHEEVEILEFTQTALPVNSGTILRLKAIDKLDEVDPDLAKGLNDLLDELMKFNWGKKAFGDSPGPGPGPTPQDPAQLLKSLDDPAIIGEAIRRSEALLSGSEIDPTTEKALTNLRLTLLPISSGEVDFDRLLESQLGSVL